jgi:hypothetical protein
VLTLAMLASALAPPPLASDAGLVVHEWGTFTSVAGSDGMPVSWRPLGGTSDLPRFVYAIDPARVRGGWPPTIKANLRALVRMETPVLYFYADQALTVSVSVTFPEGVITEWYPKARAAGSGINWGPVDVRPSGDPLPSETAPSPYYEARQTDATPVSVAGVSGREREKFLFYRGVGNVAPPLVVQLQGRRVVVRQRAHGVGPVIVFESRDGKLGFGVHDLAGPRAVLPRPTLDASSGALEMALRERLLAEGLYPREADAMIATWRASWFEEGLRVFYVVPRATTDAVLPLSLTPRPAELVRVLVARIELITPEMEHAFRQEIATAGDGPEDVQATAAALVRDRGRFAEPILRRLRDHVKDRALRRRIDALLTASATL